MLQFRCLIIGKWMAEPYNSHFGYVISQLFLLAAWSLELNLYSLLLWCSRGTESLPNERAVAMDFYSARLIPKTYLWTPGWGWLERERERERGTNQLLLFCMHASLWDLVIVPLLHLQRTCEGFANEGATKNKKKTKKGIEVGSLPNPPSLSWFIKDFFTRLSRCVSYYYTYIPNDVSPLSAFNRLREWLESNWKSFKKKWSKKKTQRRNFMTS